MVAPGRLRLGLEFDGVAAESGVEVEEKAGHVGLLVFLQLALIVVRVGVLATVHQLGKRHRNDPVPEGEGELLLHLSLAHLEGRPGLVQHFQEVGVGEEVGRKLVDGIAVRVGLREREHEGQEDGVVTTLGHRPH